jgi:hypothetical protein
MHHATAAAVATAQRAASAEKKADRRSGLTLFEVYSRCPPETMTVNIVSINGFELERIYPIRSKGL